MNIKYILLLLIIIPINTFYSQIPEMQNGFPLVIDSNVSNTMITTPLVADLNRDGSKEIIISVGIQTYSSKLIVIKSDGSIQQGFPKQFDSTFISNICAGDIDKDGYLDLVFRDNYFIHVLNRFGNEVQGFPVSYPYPNGFADKYIALYDLDGDGRLEIIAGKVGELAVFNSNGQMRAGWPQRLTGGTFLGPAIGDLDGDGNGEIVLGTVKTSPVDSGKINIFRKDGSNISSFWPVYLESGFGVDLGSPTLFINSAHQDSTYIYVPEEGPNNLIRIEKYNIYGQIKAQITLNTYDAFGTPVIGDINRDGKIEIADGTAFGHETYVFTDNLVPLPGWPQEGGGSDFWQITIGKLTNGNNLNVISSDNSSWSFGYGHIFVYNMNATQQNYSPIRPYSLIVGVTLADIDNNGSVELIASGETMNKYFLQVFTFPGIAYSNADFPWPTFAHDRYRTNQYGFVPPDETIGIKQISEIIPKKFKLYQNYPNPFNPSTKIKFDIPTEGYTLLVVYDILGREVAKLVNKTVHSGAYEISFDGSDLASGIYFAKLEVYDNNSNLINQNVIKLSLVK